MQRAVTLVMSLCILWLILRIGRSLGGRMTGVLGALTLIGTLPIADDANTANLDVPYAFWFTLSTWTTSRRTKDAATRDFLLFAGFGALAIATRIRPTACSSRRPLSSCSAHRFGSPC